MEQFFQQLLNGLAVGGIYALVALGYTMVYGVLKLINFAHGDLFTIGAYLGLTLLVSCNLAGVLPPVVAVLAVFIMVGIMVAIIGCLLERAAYRPLRKAGRLSAVVSALGASIFFQNAVMLVYGARFYVYPDWLRPDFTVDLFGIAVPGVRLMVIAASVILMLALWAFIQRTRIGAAVRAVAIDQGAARLMGINVDRIISLVFFIGPGLGGAAGLMVGIYYGQIDFTMGWSYGLKAFPAAGVGVDVHRILRRECVALFHLFAGGIVLIHCSTDSNCHTVALQFFPHAGDFARWNANAGHFFHTDGQHDAAVRLAAERLRVSAPNKKVMFHWVPPGCLWADVFGYYSRNFQKSVYFAAKNLYNIKIIAPCAKRTDCQAGSCGCA